VTISSRTLYRRADVGEGWAAMVDTGFIGQADSDFRHAIKPIDWAAGVPVGDSEK
jgi:hypothetical protein